MCPVQDPKRYSARKNAKFRSGILIFLSLLIEVISASYLGCGKVSWIHWYERLTFSRPSY